MAHILILAIYYTAMLGISIQGFHALALCIIYLQRSRRKPVIPPEPKIWPPVVVQLPVYNERFVVERLIDAACRLDYPAEALTIQVLDDSTDETTSVAGLAVQKFRDAGINITLVHRQNRAGFKAGALAAGMELTPGEYLAIFDADFVPPADFLRRLIPFLEADPRLGMVQARWGHLNDQYNAVTRAQALSLDGQLVVVQCARQAAGLVIKFSGSAGIWRRACIQDAGGWQGDTLTEDLDLTFRAALRGWRMLYYPDVLVPGEIPPQLSAYKSQLYRWAFGSTQVFKKTWRMVLLGPLNIAQRLDALVHLTAYSAHLLFLIVLLVCVPYSLATGFQLPVLPWIWVAAIGAPLLLTISQRAIYPDWKRRISYLSVMLLIGAGFGLKLSLAVLSALFRREASFNRTPKFNLKNGQVGSTGEDYKLSLDWTTLGEAAMALYCAIAAVIALGEFPRFTPLLLLISASYGYVVWMSLRHSGVMRKMPLKQTGG